MPVDAFGAGDLFTVRVIKSLATNPDNKWANSYEFQAVGAGAEGELLDLGVSLVDFEIGMHIPAVIFDRLIISTWVPDSKPYSPTSFISSTLTGVGTNAGGTDPLPLSQCLSVARIAGFGRFGHLFYRGIMNESDVHAPAGKSVLVDRASKQTLLDAKIASAGFDEYFGTGAGPFKMVMVSRDGTQVRPVIQLRAAGVSQVKTDHKWFNRTGPGSTP